jgi:hypothetical protein
MAFLLAALLGLAFGAADQQLGTLTAELGPWTSTADECPSGSAHPLHTGPVLGQDAVYLVRCLE